VIAPSLNLKTKDIAPLNIWYYFTAYVAAYYHTWQRVDLDRLFIYRDRLTGTEAPRTQHISLRKNRGQHFNPRQERFPP